MNLDFTITKIHNVIYVGEMEYTNKKHIFKNHLSHNELIFHLSGNSSVQFNGKWAHTPADTVRFLPKGENREYVVNIETPSACIDVFFDTDKPISNELFTLDFKNDKKIKALFKKIFSVWVAKNSGYQFECMSLIYKIFAHIEGSSCVNQNKNDVIVPALEYIDDNFLKQKISVKHLAQICKISESYLKKVFVKNFGVPPVKYIIGLKINYACDLMQSGIYSVSRISEMCGYADVYYFSHQFKEYMGVSPTEFKNKYKSSK